MESSTNRQRTNEGLGSIAAFERLLGVDWFEGMIVGPQHMRRADDRTCELMALLLRTEQRCGVFAVPGGEWSDAQLVRVEGRHGDQGPSSLRLQVERSAVLIAPSGRIVLLTPFENYDGVPSPIPVRVGEAHGVGEFLLTVREQCTRTREGNGGLEAVGAPLTNPTRIVAELLTYDEYVAALRGDGTDRCAIARVHLAEDAVTLDPRYLPPLSRLATAWAFDSGIVPRIRQKYQALLDFVTTNIDVLGASGDVAGATEHVRSRRSDYELLRALLVGAGGRIHAMDSLSPVEFAYAVVQPLAVWWQEFYRRQLSGPSPFTTETGLVDPGPSAERLRGLGFADLCAGTTELLRDTEQLVDSIRAFVEIFG